MKFATDHHFLIGQMHVTDGKPCQDYAISGLLDDEGRRGAFAIVSDGCSGGRHTDVGSRVGTLSLLRAITNRATGWITDPIEGTRLDYARTLASVSKALSDNAGKTLGLEWRDLLATQVYAVIDESGKLMISMSGDGTIVLIDSDGCYHIRTFEWGNNRPFYVHEDPAQFLEYHGGEDSTDYKETVCTIMPDGTVIEGGSIDISTKRGMRGIVTMHDVREERIEYVCLFSDGISQVDKVETQDAIRALLGFKTLAGNFAKRRMIRFVEDSKKTTKGPLDDISMAVIIIDQEG